MSGKIIYRVVIVPSTIFLSVMFGGAFGSGREVVQFMTQHGPLAGASAIFATGLTYAGLLVISFELARKYRAYDYNSLVSQVLGRFVWLYEAIIAAALFVVLGICMSSSGEVLNARFGLPTIFGALILFTFVTGINYGGRKLVERSMLICISMLFIIQSVLLWNALANESNSIRSAFLHPSQYGLAIFDGVKYAITGAVLIPMLVFCASDLHSRSETAIAGCIAGFVGVIPAAIFHISFLTDYPSIISERLPAYASFEALAPPIALDFYVLILFLLISQTGVGLLRGVIERSEKIFYHRLKRKMKAVEQASICVVTLMLGAMFASIGLVELIIQTYAFFSVASFLVLVIPLITIGFRKAYAPSAAH